MKMLSLLVPVLLFGSSISHVSAQAPLRLQFEVVKNDLTVASPEVSVASGNEGSMGVEGVGSFRFTPTLRGSDSLVVAFAIESGGKQLQPRLVLRDQPGSISWKSDTSSDSFELRVSWFR